jgi:hypothetical protein
MIYGNALVALKHEKARGTHGLIRQNEVIADVDGTGDRRPHSASAKDGLVWRT